MFLLLKSDKEPEVKYGKRGEAEMEKKSTELFIKIAGERGWALTKATHYQDTQEHWDWRLDKKTVHHLVDIKGLKRIDSQKEPDDSLLLVEYKNVNGNIGWLRGEAHYIAFLVKEGFAFVPRKKLLDYTMEVIKWRSKPIPSPRNKKEYIVYQRSQWGRKDLFAYLKKEEIIKLSTVFWRI